MHFCLDTCVRKRQCLDRASSLYGGKVMSLFSKLVVLAFFIAGLILGPVDRAFAQEGQSLANQTANPLGGDFMLVINQFDFIHQQGRAVDGPGPLGMPGRNPLAPSDPTVNIYTMQPVISAPLNNVIGPGWSFVMRPTVQYFFDTDLPNPSALGLGGGLAGGPPPLGLPFQNVDGWGDVSTFALVGKTIPTMVGGGGAFVIAPGIAAGAPWGDAEFTNDKYTLGPALAAAYIGKPGVLGVVAQQFWDVADDRSGGTAPDVSKMLLQVPYYINLTEKWQLGAAPLWILDWENDEYEIPLGLGLTYTGPIPGLPVPMKVGFEVSTYVDHNDIYGGDWAVKVFAIPILPSPVRKLFPGLYR